MSHRNVLRWYSCVAVTIWLAAPAAAQPLVAPTEALSPAEQQQKFHLPPGFEIQLFAAEPAIHKPMNITFDSHRRLWLTDTLEYPYPVKDGVTPRDTVKILADTDGDGSADQVTTFVDKLNIPLGVMPDKDSVVVYSIPSIKRCTDTDGDGQADTRETLYANFGHRDTHGMVNSFTRGLDGWLYACHGFSNDSSPQGTDGQAIKMNSGNVFRMRIDGSHVEYHTHGQVNPFGLSFDPLGNLYSADCHTLPVYMLLRGAYYPSFGKPHDGLGFGPTMIKHNHKSTGIGGIAYYAAEQFPPDYRDTIFIGNPVTGCVNHDRLAPHGSTYEAVELADFITCDDPWFRPVNLQVGPDGRLVRGRFLQLHHRPLRSAARTPAPRPTPGPHLARCLYRPGRRQPAAKRSARGSRCARRAARAAGRAARPRQPDRADAGHAGSRRTRRTTGRRAAEEAVRIAGFDAVRPRSRPVGLAAPGQFGRYAPRANWPTMPIALCAPT